MKSIAISLIALLSFPPNLVPDVKQTVSTIKGTWVYVTFEEREEKNISVYSREVHFNKDKGGKALKQNGKLIVRQNVGWCGTPPITYGNYPGTWKLTGNNKLTLHHKYWGGWIDEDYEVVSLTSDTLKLLYLKHSVHKEEEK